MTYVYVCYRVLMYMHVNLYDKLVSSADKE